MEPAAAGVNENDIGDAPDRCVVSVVLNWNQLQLTLDALRSLADQDVPPGFGHHILLVDNGSDDGSVEAVQSSHPEVAILALPENLGFAGGANAGIQWAYRAGAAWTLLVNNDTLAEPDLLAKLLGAAESEPSIGAAVPTVTYYDRPDVVWPSAGYRRRLTLAGNDTTANPPSDQPYDVEWAVGCCMLVRSDLWEDVGLFDERFRMYYEDHDLCLRARSAGWRIVHVPRARIQHRVAASTGPGSPRQAYMLARSSVSYFWTHTKGLHRPVIFGYRVLSLGRRLIEAVMSGRPAVGRAHLEGLRDGLIELRRGDDRPKIPRVRPTDRGGKKPCS